MILIFDLDDTLYDEMTFVISGLSAVADYGQIRFGWDAAQSLAFMTQVLQDEGRGKVFDRWLIRGGKHSKSMVSECVKVYRHHKPKLDFSPAAKPILDRYQGQTPLYLVTDGHKITQRNKVEALNLKHRFKRCFITHEFGIQNAKPSIHCFDIIRRAENCNWTDMVYVGDNPAKDFVNLNPLGTLTVRVLTGSHKDAIAKPGFDAQHTIQDLTELPMVLERHFKKQ